MTPPRGHPPGSPYFLPDMVPSHPFKRRNLEDTGRPQVTGAASRDGSAPRSAALLALGSASGRARAVGSRVRAPVGPEAPLTASEGSCTRGHGLLQTPEAGCTGRASAGAFCPRQPAGTFRALKVLCDLHGERGRDKTLEAGDIWETVPILGATKTPFSWGFSATRLFLVFGPNALIQHLSSADATSCPPTARHRDALQVRTVKLSTASAPRVQGPMPGRSSVMLFLEPVFHSHRAGLVAMPVSSSKPGGAQRARRADTANAAGRAHALGEQVGRPSG